MNITFKNFTPAAIPLYYEWAEKEHVKVTYFKEGYEPKEYILEKIKGNGIDYPFLIFTKSKAIGFIQYWDVAARDLLEKEQLDYFTGSPPGTYGIDLFIGETEYLDKGYGAEILRQFIKFISERCEIKKLVLDPDIDNRPLSKLFF